MSWYKQALHELTKGRDVALINRGSSMRGLIEDGQIVILGPVSGTEIKTGDMVMARIRKGRFIVHLVQDISGKRYLIGNNLGGLDGWVTSDALYGIVKNVLDEIPQGTAMKLLDENDAT